MLTTPKGCVGPAEEKARAENVVHLSEIIDKHYHALEAAEPLLSQLETKAYNMGDQAYGSSLGTDENSFNDAVEAPPQGYPAQYLALLARQERQLTRLTQVVNSLNTVI